MILPQLRLQLSSPTRAETRGSLLPSSLFPSSRPWCLSRDPFVLFIRPISSGQCQSQLSSSASLPIKSFFCSVDAVTIATIIRCPSRHRLHPKLYHNDRIATARMAGCIAKSAVANGIGVQVEDTKICVVMVGLPARGKSFIAQKGLFQYWIPAMVIWR